MKILQKLYRYLMQGKYPKNLLINGRPKLASSAFQDDDRLFHAFDHEDLEEDDSIKLNTIRFPDFSCNWGRFSNPGDIRFRKNGRKTDGCYSFSVLTSRYNKWATPVHDPFCDFVYPNYSHVEVRALFDGEDVLFEPEKKRKLTPKPRRLEYRFNIKRSLRFEFPPKGY